MLVLILYGKKTSLGVLTSELKKNTIMVHQELDRFFLMTDFHNIPHILATYFQRPMQLETEVLPFRLKEEGDTLWKHCASSDHLAPPSESVDAQPIGALQQWFHVRNGQLKSPQSSVLHTEFSCLPTWMVAIITSASSDFNTWMASWRSKSGWAFLSFFRGICQPMGTRRQSHL